MACCKPSGETKWGQELLNKLVVASNYMKVYREI